MRSASGSLVSDEAELEFNDPQTLYRRWEESQWSPFTIDLSADVTQWAQMHGDQRELILFVLSSLMVAEERITTKFSGLVGSYASEEEASFLCTQQVDEARHMQFYARFQDEVVSGPDVIAAHVDRARPRVSDAFGEIFDKALVRAHRRLVEEPEDLAAKVSFVTLYHVVLEATLGLTSFKFTTDHLSREGLLPGFVEGYSKIHHDETRHIAYGVWFLRETVRARSEMADVVRRTLRELLPSVAASLAPPDTGSSRDFEAIGASGEEIRAFALGGLERRLDHIGVPLDSL
jgi:ribonucleoside-diphosphate reductase beta chain